MIPEYNITGQRISPEQIVDIIPEQEKQDAQIQASEEKYLQQLRQNSEDRIRNTEKTWSQIADLSSTLGDFLQKKQEKFRQDREAEISLEILTRGVSPELEAQFRGERDKLFDDHLATNEFASKYESETGDSITAQEFRKMAGWEKYMVAEQYALEKAKGYDQYVYDAYDTVKIDVIRDGKQVSVGHFDQLSPSEQAALDTKIKFEYAKQFAGLNEALVATVVKPEIDKFDAARQKKQAVEREKAYQSQVAASDKRMIAVGFSTANPSDGHQLAHDFAAQYAARNRTSISEGRNAFADNLVDLVSSNTISYPEAMAIVNHEITARDGSQKSMTSWKEWAGLPSDLAEAAKKAQSARDDARENDIAADIEVVKSMQNLGNDQKIQLMEVYKQKYDGVVPTELADTLRGSIDDWQAEDMIEKSIRNQGGVYDFEMANVSTEIFNKYKDKILTSGALVPGTEQFKQASDFIKAYTNEATEDTFGETDIKSPEWLTLNANLTEIFNRAYKQAYIRDGRIVGTTDDAFKAGLLAVENTVNNGKQVLKLMKPSFEDSGDRSYSRRVQLNMTQSSGGKWRNTKLSASKETEKELIEWSQTPLKSSKDIPDLYKDLAMRMGVNPVDLANSQLKFYMDPKEIKDEKTKEQKYNEKVLNLIYKYPTRSRITRARLEDEGAGEANVKTSIYNKKALIRKDK